MRTSTVEHETEEKLPGRSAETEREESAAPTAPFAGARPAFLDPRMLLALQSRAGNAAVADLIEERRKPEPAADSAGGARATKETGPASGAEGPPESKAPDAVAAGSAADGGPTNETGPVSGAEGDAEGKASEAAGESDEDLGSLDKAAAESAADDDADSGREQETVASDAQAELGDLGKTSDESAETPGAGADSGTPIPATPKPAIPKVNTAEPNAALAQVGGLPPALLLSSLGEVSAAVSHQATQEEQKLTANPPRRPGPSGVSPEQSATAFHAATVDRPRSETPKAAEAPDIAVRQPPAPPMLPEVRPTNGQLPIRDPGVELKTGPLPDLALRGSADPQLVQQHHTAVVGKLQQEHAARQQEATHPLGEDQIFPTVAAEVLHAVLPQAPGANGHPAAAPAAEDDEAASVIAQQEKAGAIQDAVNSGLSTLSSQRQEYAQRSAGERTKAEAEMTQLEEANSKEQAGERAAAKQDVLGLRSQWTVAQRDLVDGAQREADAKTGETLQSVSQQRTEAEQQAQAHYQQGQREADQARQQAEQQAAAEKHKAQGQGIGGVLGAIGSAAQGLFDKAKQAVQSVFDRARQLVRGAIERAQQLATSVLEKARQSITAAIRMAGTVLSAIGDRVLAAFPVLRDRFRRLIQDRIAAAEAVVNKLANTLKHAVQNSLNMLGAALTSAIGILQKGMQAAIDGVRAVVRGALDFARSAISALGVFAALIRDVAANPGQWLSNLAAAARDGIKNHLWPDLKSAVQAWFNAKVEGILGLGSAVWSLLKRGGITFVQIAHVAWEGIKSMIPQTVIWVLIEKLVSLIVPAAAAVMLIIQALQAAWASIGRIIQAFDAFMAFLKQVRWGNAAALFGKAVASGAVAVIEFISQFLLQRLMSAAGPIAGKIRALARRIGARLAAAGRGIARGARWLASKARRMGGAIKSTARRTIARPQVRWHAWRIKRAYGHSNVATKLDHLVKDPSLEPALKLEFLRTVRPNLRGPAADPWEEMIKVVRADPEHWCLKGEPIPAKELLASAPMTKLVSLRRVFNEMLEPSYKQRFTDFDDWKSSVAQDASAFNPRLHLRKDADLGRFWSPKADAPSSSLEDAINQRQLDPSTYSDGALRVRVDLAAGTNLEFHKPTALDAVYFDRWQVPKKASPWGTITTTEVRTGERVVIREAVTGPVEPTFISDFETLFPTPTKVQTTVPQSVPMPEGSTP